MSNQKSGLVPGIIVGLVAMLAGAALYGAIIGITKYEIGIATIGVGVLVGLGIMAVKPTSPVLPPLAAVFGLAGAALGQIVGATILLVEFAQDEGVTMSYTTAAGEITGEFGALISEDPKSLLFWAIGAAAAFSFVNKRVKAANEPADQPQPTSPAQS
ncbi:hypothetical protein ACFLIM_44370 [Nonomuraea sp. M3C6]|uniref:Uncharacterized protein n=1 Tax=Nonomuraea marmarensis TaxID=3351344 RepID=A0ABW7AVV5_9ACTN